MLKFILVTLTLVAMFGIFKNMMSGTSEDLKKELHPNALLVDVRTPEEFASGHVVGSINIPLNDIVSELHQFQNQDQIIVFCRSGNRSSQAKSILESNGIKNVVNGGTWQQVNKIVHQKDQ